MDNIPRLVEQLHSPSKDKRYEACELLRAAPSLPPEALGALQAAAHDPDPRVADSATQAVALHTGSETRMPSSAAGGALAGSFWDHPFLTGPVAALALYTLVVWLPLLLVARYFSAFPAILWVCVSPLLAILGLLCGVLARFARNPGKAAAIAGAVLGSAAGILTVTLGNIPE